VSPEIRDETESDAPDVFAIHASAFGPDAEARPQLPRLPAGGLPTVCSRSVFGAGRPDQAAPIV
jgi:hypothetical protein